jgi:hypothetical protein
MATISVGAIAAMLAAVALLLVGCGGGGGGTTTTACLDSNGDKTKFSLKTQSFEGTGSVTLVLNGSEHIIDNGQATIGQKLDMEKLSIWENFSVSTKVKGMSVNVNLNAFLSADKKMAGVYVHVDNGTMKYENCSYAKLAMEKVTPAQIKMMLGVAVSVLGKEMTCSTDGTYDTWVLKEKIPDPRIPQKLLPFLVNVTGSLAQNIQYSKDSMLHSIAGTIDTKTPSKTINGTFIPAVTTHIEESLTVNGGSAKPEGPQDKDLDYTSWETGSLKCVEEKPSSLKDFFKRSRDNAFNKGFGTLAPHSQISPFSELMLTTFGGLLQEQPRAGQAAVVTSLVI